MQKRTSQLLQSIFDVNHPFLQIAERLFDLIVLNLLTVLTSLPLVTLGLAKLALQASLWEMEEKKKIKVLQTYWKYLKQFRRQGIILTGLEVGVTSFCLLDLYLVWGQGGLLIDVFRVLCIAVLLFSQLLWVYLYPLVARYSLSIRESLIHAVLWMGSQLGLTFKVSLVYLVLALVLLISDWSLLIGLVCLACFAYAGLSYLFIKAFSAIEQKKN